MKSVTTAASRRRQKLERYVFRRDRSPFLWIRMPTMDGRRKRCSTGTEDVRTANAIAQMVEQLRQRADFVALDAITAGRRTLTAMWSDYCQDARLEGFKATLDDFDLQPHVSRWHASLVARRIGSADEYLALLRRFIPAAEPFPRSRFTKVEIRDFLNALTKTPRAKKPDKHAPPVPVSGATRNRYHNAIRVFARWLLEENDDVLEYNPASVVRKAKEITGHVIYSPGEVKQLVESLTGEVRALSALMAGTGMEWQAIERVTRRDVDSVEKTVHAHGSKNEWRNRTCAVTEDWCWRIVDAWARTLAPEDHLFRIGHKVALEAHHAACEALSLPKTTLHGHRHHYAVMLRRRGVSDVVIASQLGHHDTQLVARRYGRYKPGVAEVTRAAGGLDKRGGAKTNVRRFAQK